jgi:hypothetical protein
MTTTEWITDIALLLIVLRQVRESHLDRTLVVIPLAIVAWVAHHYLHSIPTAGNDLVLILALVAAGATLGIAGGLSTRVRFDGQRVLVRAGLVAAVLWVVGMGARMGFQLFSQYGGAASIERFSIAHRITSDQAWVTAFVLMAVTEVVTRMATIVYRGYLVRHAGPSTPTSVPAYAMSAR